MPADLTDISLGPAHLHGPRPSTGGICLLCRWAADHGHPHPCITKPGAQEVLEDLYLTHDTEVPLDITLILRIHPARPLPDGNNLRPVHSTWCNCQCQPTPKEDSNP